jgi:hypothetical protein
MAEAASVRTAKPSTSMSKASNGKPPTSLLNPALSGSKPLMAKVRLAYHQHRQDVKRKAADLASQPSADCNRNDGTRDRCLC